MKGTGRWSVGESCQILFGVATTGAVIVPPLGEPVKIGAVRDSGGGGRPVEGREAGHWFVIVIHVSVCTCVLRPEMNLILLRLDSTQKRRHHRLAFVVCCL